MGFWDAFCFGLLVLGFVKLARECMFDDAFGRSLNEWFTITARREGWARVVLILVMTEIILNVLHMLANDGAIPYDAWHSDAAILLLQLICQWWWITSGKFAREWQEWNDKAAPARAEA